MGLLDFFKPSENINNKEDELLKPKKRVKPSELYFKNDDCFPSMIKYKFDYFEAFMIGEKGKYWDRAYYSGLHQELFTKDLEWNRLTLKPELNRKYFNRLISKYEIHKDSLKRKLGKKVDSYNSVVSFIRNEKLVISEKININKYNDLFDITERECAKKYNEFKHLLYSLELKDRMFELWFKQLDCKKEIKTKSDEKIKNSLQLEIDNARGLYKKTRQKLRSHHGYSEELYSKKDVIGPLVFDLDPSNVFSTDWISQPWNLNQV